jgi:hypothetical protein
MGRTEGGIGVGGAFAVPQAAVTLEPERLDDLQIVAVANTGQVGGVAFGLDGAHVGHIVSPPPARPREPRLPLPPVIDHDEIANEAAQNANFDDDSGGDGDDHA